MRAPAALQDRNAIQAGMARFRRPVLALLLTLPLALRAEPGQTQSLVAAVHAGRWPQAASAASGLADPVAAKLVEWLRLIAPPPAGTPPGIARAQEIAAFRTQNPGWPGLALLSRRRDEAIAAEPDPAQAAAECDRPAPFSVTRPATLLRCAEAEAAQGNTGAAGAYATRAWIAGPADPAWESQVLARWGDGLDADAQRARFDRLAWSNPAPAGLTAAQRQAARLSPADQPRALAWLALRRNAANAPTLLASLPETDRRAPLLALEEARWLRHAGQTGAEAAFWGGSGAMAEAAAAPAQQGAFWAERDLLARQMLRAGDVAGAFAVADGFAGTGGEARLDADFLAAFIALRRLDRPDLAETHLRSLLLLSRAAITQARGHYWLGRAAETRGQAEAARAEYQAAIAFPATYYGQLAARAQGEDPRQQIRAAALPPAPPEQALALAGQERARAAVWLVAWGEPGRAQEFLLRLDQDLPDPTDRAVLARLAQGLGLPQIAVAISRRAGLAGMTLLPQGWPVAASLPGNTGVDPALVLGVIRQESSFDSEETSPAGARGLMQLMPATAAEMAKKLDLRLAPASLTTDPQTNITLGAAYLAGLLARYQGSVPLAVAAYNAGPGRVTSWLAGQDTPRPGSPDMIDWIEEIPFSETRNYVQRVIENQEIYRAELDTLGP